MSILKTAVVTGINGQLGQYMALCLLSKGVRVVGTLRHKTARNETYIFDQSKVTFELMDLGDAPSIEAVIARHKPDYFFNTAANAFVGESWIVPTQHLQVNALGVLHQLEAIRKHSPHTRYINLGTSEEFGAVEYTPQDEKHPPRPQSPYGASKCAARGLVRVWRESYKLYALQCWCFNFESPLRDEKYLTRKVTKGVARIARAIKDGQSFSPIELGNLNSHRAWQHASDVAEGLWLMANQTGTPKEYVLSSDEAHQVRRFVELAFRETGFVNTAWVGSAIGGVASPESETYQQVRMVNLGGPSVTDVLVRVNPCFYRPAEVSYLLGTSARARAELGWSPKVGFPQLVREMVQSDLRAVGL